jgi:putative nucleotidyltransferase with HDIG domain
MATMKELRSGVRKSLPEIERIGDADLRERVVEAWALALSETEYGSIDEIRPSGGPVSPPMKHGTQAHHLRGVATMAVAMADALEEMVGPLGISRDILLAGGLCHDLGKPYEFSPRNRARWQANPAAEGYPAFRHPVYGAHLALSAGLPAAVAHICAAHSAEGEGIVRSLENTLVHLADHAFWTILTRAGALDDAGSESAGMPTPTAPRVTAPKNA